MKVEIKIKEGISNVKFNCSPELVRAVYGEPDDTEELDNPCDGSLESLVWNYDDLGLNFFFDTTGMEPVLITIESENTGTELFGKQLFQLTKADIILLMKMNDFPEFEEEDETWGEHRLTYEDAQLDFYFADGDLTLVSWSAY
jgi:hypothetical protein